MVFPKLGWKNWLLITLGGLSVGLGFAALHQWKYATLGKQVSTNVLKFLIDHGSHIEGGVVSGGIVKVPMKTNTTVNSIVLQLLQAVASTLEQEGGAGKEGEEKEDDGQQVYTSSERPSSKPATRAPPPPSSSRSASSAPSAPAPKVSATASATVTRSPVMTSSPGSVRDDCGFTNPNRGKDGNAGEYNPGEFTPTAKGRVSVEEMMKDDGGEGFQ